MHCPRQHSTNPDSLGHPQWGGSGAVFCVGNPECRHHAMIAEVQGCKQLIWPCSPLTKVIPPQGTLLPNGRGPCFKRNWDADNNCKHHSPPKRVPPHTFQAVFRGRAGEALRRSHTIASITEPNPHRVAGLPCWNTQPYKPPQATQGLDVPRTHQSSACKCASGACIK